MLCYILFILPDKKCFDEGGIVVGGVVVMILLLRVK